MGTVRTTDNRTVDSMRVALMNEDYQMIKVVFTDGSGRYRFPPVSSGVYLVKVMPVGSPYEESSQRLDLQAMRILGGGSSGGGGSQPSSGEGRGGSQEPTLVDFVLKRKRVGSGSLSNEVVFAQNIPDTARAEYKRGSERLKDNPDEAMGALKKAVEIFPDYYDALVLLGTAYVNRDDFENALPLLERAVGVNKNGWLAFYSLGIARTKSNQLADGTEALRRAAELNPQSVEASMDYAKALAKNAKTEEDAIQVFSRVARDHGRDGRDAYFMLASLYSKRARYGEAADALEAYVKSLAPSEVAAEQRENYRKAIERLRRKAAEAKSTK
jgi:tetratricopeptide (TPR) repeat protein